MKNSPPLLISILLHLFACTSRSFHFPPTVQISILISSLFLLLLLYFIGDLSGAESYYTIHDGVEVMFHVSTLLPFTPDRPVQIERKKRILLPLSPPLSLSVSPPFLLPRLPHRRLSFALTLRFCSLEHTGVVKIIFHVSATLLSPLYNLPPPSNLFDRR